MARIDINQNIKINEIEGKEIVNICPFDAIEYKDGKLDINSACKMCKICTKQKPEIFTFIEGEQNEIDKSLWNGVVVYVEHTYGNIHPVTLELLGKAKELADKIGHEVLCLFAGYNIKEAAEELLHFGADKVFVYDNKELEDYRIEPYAAVFEDFINNNSPSVILVGGTTIGRSLAPRVAARFSTGLTADCTSLDIEENTDLIQIRPAFGGNLMATIVCPNHRPQMSTVRPGVMEKAERQGGRKGEIIPLSVSFEKDDIRTRILEVVKEAGEAVSLTDAEIIVSGGMGLGGAEGFELLKKLADKLGGVVAASRAAVDAGWIDHSYQVGQTGTTVRPKLYFACGISGAIQHVAGMQNSEQIIAINKNPAAPIVEVADYGIVGDFNQVIPALIEALDK
ncbi:MAG TPA: electron transfer flavoprotein subunit alpha [Clostridiales bacterium]|nr:electron transfer flavoprotein subunit alpha [Clostridiales bacterium]